MIAAHLLAGGAGADRGIDPLAQRGPGVRERRVKLAVGRDLLGRYPGQLARLPGVGASTPPPAGQLPAGMRRDAHHVGPVGPAAALGALPGVLAEDARRVRRDPPDLLCGLADGCLPRRLVVVHRATEA